MISYGKITDNADNCEQATHINSVLVISVCPALSHKEKSLLLPWNHLMFAKHRWSHLCQCQFVKLGLSVYLVNITVCVTVLWSVSFQSGFLGFFASPHPVSHSAVPLLCLFLFFIPIFLFLLLLPFNSFCVSLSRLRDEPPGVSEGSSDPKESPAPSSHLSVRRLHGLCTLLHHHRADGERQSAPVPQR